MSKLDELIKTLCPDGVEYINQFVHILEVLHTIRDKKQSLMNIILLKY